MRPLTASVSALLGMTMAMAATAAEPFNYDYLGLTYDYQRIGVDGFSEELEGHRVTAIYSEELKQGLIYQAFGTSEFTDDELMTSGNSYFYERDSIDIGVSLGAHLPITAKADAVGTAKVGYAFYDTYSRLKLEDEIETTVIDEKGSEPFADLSVGVRWFIDDYNSLDIQPLLGVILTEDTNDAYFRGRVSARLVGTIEAYLDMTTYLDSDYRAFGTGIFLYY
ncbi:MAG: hypothetical protein QF808_11090 [Thalassolituus sp.]|uniref:hypothetical protein n=1 Tax=unclassified Thalassolituus TaxID=2624967 RepID=UPI00263B7251|nr:MULTISPECIES: hypothetical protein [unclassified Thalassolituus]MDQ4424439.1 hypothetical protein [Thalassolituus sp.]MDQ4425860.1 hypothetical protein [Thalassolituus sp.]|tara:strand:- start:2005 stop:2673 length:669 start_codon:yes stop_codon:yes gene_type:complete